MNPLNKNNYSAQDFIQYHSEKMPDIEMHQLEKAALEDNFISDALDGYYHSNNAEKNLHDLKNKVSTQFSINNSKSTSTYRKFYLSVGVAASLIIVLFIGYNNFSKKSEEKLLIAKVESTPAVSEQNENSIDDGKSQQEFKKQQPVENEEIRFTPPKIDLNEKPIISDKKISINESNSSQIDLAQNSVSDEKSIIKDNEELNSDLKRPATSTLHEDIKSADEIQSKKIETAVVKDIAIRNINQINPAVPVAAKTATTNEDFKNSMMSYPAEGWESYNNYIKENKRKIQDSTGISCKGILILSFSVNNNGSPEKIEVDQSLNVACDNAGILLLTNGPKWIKTNERTIFTIKF